MAGPVRKPIGRISQVALNKVRAKKLCSKKKAAIKALVLKSRVDKVNKKEEKSENRYNNANWLRESQYR
jgi:hypothetical protein